MFRRNSSFSAVTKHRLPFLVVLENRELSTGEVAFELKQSRENAYHHLGILVKAGLVEKKIEKKRNWSRLAKHKFFKIQRYFLTSEGKEALAYFRVKANV